MSSFSEIIKYKEGILDQYNNYSFKSPGQASMFLWKNKNIFIWNILTCFEGIPVSLSETEAILNGFNIESVETRDLLKIKSYERAIEQLCFDIRDKIFIGDKFDLINLHRLAARFEIEEEILGMFRRENVTFKNVNWRPPACQYLSKYWIEVEKLINQKERILENSLVVFLMLSRIQFFPDVNKRTAMAFANGCLMKNCLAPFMIPNKEIKNFGFYLSDFYETGQANNILKFIAETSLVENEPFN